ncbi:MAG: dynamin family protein [Alicyclobacillaceae bacterium]|nr:dynamin family protein [Alicyclobacillaceae bacterium]
MAKMLTPPEEKLEHIESLARLLEEWNDIERAAKVRDLARKWADQEAYVAFCGHFSAGKSTLINTWIGDRVLPSGPLPTTAAGVLIRRGPERVRLHFRSGAMREMERLQDWAEVARWCIGEDDVRFVEIWHSRVPLPDKVAFLDTPGVDSTDPRHQEITEAVLHLADLVVYTMDYNHVQARVNRTFVERLVQRRKPVFLVVNQIDKHAEYELPFLQFQYEVKQTFEPLGISSDRMYYTSLRCPDHPHHQLRELQEDVLSLLRGSDGWLFRSVEHSLRHLVEEHIEAWLEQQREETEAAERRLAEEHAEELLRRYDELVEQRRRWESCERFLEDDAWRVLTGVVSSARITPYDVAERAERYLESLRPGFRAGGWLWGKGRTEQERGRRLAALAEAFGRLLQTELDRHVRAWARQTAESWGVATPELLDRIERERVPFDETWVAALVKPGAVGEERYVHTFVRDLETAGKELYRKLGRRFLDEIKAAVSARRDGILAAMEEEAERLEPYAEAREILRSIRDGADRRRRELLARIPDLGPGADAGREVAAAITVPPVAGPIARGGSESESGAVTGEGVEVSETGDTVPPAPGDSGVLIGAGDQISAVPFPAQRAGPGRGLTGSAKTAGEPRFLQMAARLRRAAALLGELPGTEDLVAGLETRAVRLEDRQFTVALFGAFSAGKSSLANALLGSAVLPSSPNPTTAVIQRVTAPDARYPHGTAVLFVRTREEMEKWMRLASESGDEVSVEAARRRRDEMEPYLGQILTVQWDAVRNLVVREEWAAYLSRIDLYWDSPFTAGGWILIDTPGVDSLNNRHTDVAFDYIRQSDAVVFVTYFNHAFSRADQSFLRQLGRVQDAFTFEKTFFVINASDLAADRGELEAVTEHVRRQLVQLGITRPQLFPLSSQGALLAALAAERPLSPEEEARFRERLRCPEGPLPTLEEAWEVTGFAAFYRAFSTLLREDLADIALAQARAELDRARGVVERWVDEAKATEGEKAQRRSAWSAGGAVAKEVLASYDASPLIRGAEAEIEELCDHVERRLAIRYQDQFREIFSLAAFGAGSERDVLMACASELSDWLEEELRQEWRATALRAERWFREARDRAWAGVVAGLSGEIPGWSWQPVEQEPWEMPAPPESTAVRAVVLEAVPRLFPGMRRWIESGMQETRASLWEVLVPEVGRFVADMRQTLREWVRRHGEEMLAVDRQNAVEAAAGYVAGMIGALDWAVPPERLEDILRRWPQE